MIFKTFLGYKNETQSESDGEQDSTSNDDGDDDDDSSTDGSTTSDQKLFCKSSATRPRKLNRKHRVTHKSPSKSKVCPLEDENALSESAQRSQGKIDGKETSPGLLTSLSNNSPKNIEFDCMRKLCKNNSDLQPSATDVLSVHSKYQQDMKDNVEEDLVSQSLSTRTQCHVQKRKSSTQTGDKKRTKMKKRNSEHSSKIETSSSLNMQSFKKRCVKSPPQKTKEGEQRKLPLVENGHESTRDDDKSDISVMTDEDSNDSTSNLSLKKLCETKETIENNNCRIGCVTLLDSRSEAVAGSSTFPSLQSTSVNQNDVDHSNEEKEEIHTSQTSVPLPPLEFLLHSDDSQSSLCSASQEKTSPLCDVLVENSCHGNQQETKNWKDSSSEDGTKKF